MITRPKGALSWAVSLLALAVTATAQTAPKSQPATQSPFAALISIYLARDASGHSPSADDISGIAALNPPPDANAVHEAVPLILKALADPDVPLHTFALTALTGLQATPVPPPAQPNVPQPPPGPLYYKPEIAKQLAPIIPQIAAHLTDDAQSDRLLAANVLGGFTPNPPAAVFPPLIAYLKRDDAISQVGFAVVTDLLQLGVTDEVATAITRYLARRDQTSESRSNLADLIASNPHQSQAINHSLLAYLDSDDNSLRARVILSLPQMDLSPADFATAQSRVNILATNPNENLQVINAAKSVTGCWTAVKMLTGCPVY